MKITVCIKQIEQVYARTGDQPKDHYLEDNDRIYRINPYDEAAMQMAASLKKELDADITVLILGPVIAETELYRCLSLGADEVYHIQDTPDRNVLQKIDSLQKSKILASAILPLQADVILCGKKSLDTQNGQVGALIAHHLGLGFVSSASHITVNRETGMTEVTKKCGRGVKQIIECKLPVVLSVALSDTPDLMPTWEEKQNAKNLTFRHVWPEIELPREKIIRKNLFPPRPRPKSGSSINPGNPSYDRVMQLLSPSLVQKKGSIKKGAPDDLAKDLFDFLKDNGFLKALEGNDK